MSHTAGSADRVCVCDGIYYFIMQATARGDELSILENQSLPKRISRVSGDCQGSFAATAVELKLQNRLDIQIILYLF